MARDTRVETNLDRAGKSAFATSALILVFLTAAALAAQTPETELRWIPATSTEIEVDGLPWFAENQGETYRLPIKLEKTFRPAVWNLAKSPSGGRIRFRTDSSTVAVRLEYPSAPNMNNMHAFGQTGVDLYANGRYVATAIADKDAAAHKTYEKVLLEATVPPRVEREIVLYLALYKPVKVLGIGIEKDAKIKPARAFALPKPVVFYGTSITQGGCAGRSGMSYQAILGRLLNIDFVNLGFSGNGMGEPEVARAVAQIDASCFVLDFAQNNRTIESVAEVYAPFIATLREKHPDTPILAITPIYAAREGIQPWKAEVQKMRDHIRQVVSKRIAEGDRNLQLIEGTDLLGPSQGDGLVDGSHPNDLGFQWMADGLAARLRKFLGLR